MLLWTKEIGEERLGGQPCIIFISRSKTELVFLEELESLIFCSLLSWKIIFSFLIHISVTSSVLAIAKENPAL